MQTIMLHEKAPLFSIVTATFNARGTFNLTAASLGAQTCSDFEWIVIDGGSCDGTVEYLRECKLISFLLSEPDNGIADAWNKGINRSHGRFVVILNAGDTLDPTYLETMKRFASDDRIACCHVRLKTETDIQVGIMRAEPEKLWRGMHLPHNWCVVPLHFYRDLGGYPHRRYGMDFDWFHRYFKLYRRDGFIVVDQVLGTYHLGGVSDRGFVASFRENERILCNYGMYLPLARILRFAYTMKHMFTRRLMQR